MRLGAPSETTYIRSPLHATIVDAIERLYDPQLTEHVEILAHHAVRGGVAYKAVHYLREAAAKAAARSANREAVEFFAAALENVKALPRSDETSPPSSTCACRWALPSSP